jgi:hypothetical protein
MEKHKKRKNYRPILLTFGVILFLLAATSLLFYALGYQYDFQKHEILKTGTINITTKPQNVQVYVNGKLKKKSTPATISSLLPGTYHISIQKDSYHTWEFQARVDSGKVTKFDKIILLLNNPLSQNIGQNVQQFEISQDQNTIIYQAGTEIFSYNTGSNKSNKLDIVPGADFKFIFWNTDNNNFLYFNNQIFSVYNLKNDQISSLPNTISPSAKIIFGKNNQEFVYLESNILKNYNLSNNQTSVLFNNIDDFVYQSNVYALQQVDNKSFQLVQSGSDGSNPKTLIQNLAGGKLFLSELGDLSFLNSEHELYLYNTSTNQFNLLNKNVKVFSFGIEKKTLWTFSYSPQTFECWITDLDEIILRIHDPITTRYLTRISGSIDSIADLNGFENLAYVSNNTIHIIDQYGANDFAIGSIKNNQIVLNQDGTRIYFLDLNSSLKYLQIR